MRQKLTYAGIAQDLLSLPEREWKSYLGDPERPSMYVLVLKSLNTALGDSDIAHKERRFIVERLEGKPREIREATLTLTDLTQSPFASSIREAIAGITEKVMIEAGPDKNDPTAGATYAEIIRKPSQIDKDAHELAMDILQGEAIEAPAMPAMDRLTAKVAVDIVQSQAPQRKDTAKAPSTAQEHVPVELAKKRAYEREWRRKDRAAKKQRGVGVKPPFANEISLENPPPNFPVEVENAE